MTVHLAWHTRGNTTLWRASECATRFKDVISQELHCIQGLFTWRGIHAVLGLGGKPRASRSEGLVALLPLLNINLH